MFQTVEVVSIFSSPSARKKITAFPPNAQLFLLLIFLLGLLSRSYLSRGWWITLMNLSFTYLRRFTVYPKDKTCACLLSSVQQFPPQTMFICVPNWRTLECFLLAAFTVDYSYKRLNVKQTLYRNCFYLHTHTHTHTCMKNPRCWVSPSTVIPSPLPRRLTACSCRWVQRWVSMPSCLTVELKVWRSHAEKDSSTGAVTGWQKYTQ